MGSIARWYEFAELFAFCDLHASRVSDNAWRIAEKAWRMLLPTGEFDPTQFWPRYFDRQGFPIPSDGEHEPTIVWAMKREHDDVSIASDELPDGSRLSTVWLGLDHGFGVRPLFFETMRFSAEVEEVRIPFSTQTQACHSSMPFPDPYGEDGDETEQLRYGSEEEALAAHHEIVRRIVRREGH